jgi:MYXO-CTERM domain-containing protein
MKIATTVSLAATAAFAGVSAAQTVDVIGGQTSVLLDTDTLSSAASLDLSGVSGDVIVPGTIDGSVAFGINPRNASTLPTTFSYDPSDFLNTFSGTIEHTGSVFFNNDAVEVGDFTIGFDANRVGGDRSGFFVESNAGLSAILFDVATPGQLDPGSSELVIGADLLVSSEFGSFLLDNGFSGTNLAGADVGDALVEGVVPAPAGMGVLALAGLAASRRRR